MPSKVPNHSVHLLRENPKGRKDKEGNVIHDPVRPEIGKPFDFTDEEVRDIEASSPYALRDPVNEGGENVDVRDADEADRVAREAAEEAARVGKGAIGDARETARAGAAGKGARKQPDNSGRGESPGPEADGEDEL